MFYLQKTIYYSIKGQLVSCKSGNIPNLLITSKYARALLKGPNG
jgi:hypothetical protein